MQAVATMHYGTVVLEAGAQRRRRVFLQPSSAFLMLGACAAVALLGQSRLVTPTALYGDMYGDSDQSDSLLPLPVLSPVSAPQLKLSSAVSSTRPSTHTSAGHKLEKDSQQIAREFPVFFSARRPSAQYAERMAVDNEFAKWAKHEEEKTRHLKVQKLDAAPFMHQMPAPFGKEVAPLQVGHPQPFGGEARPYMRTMPSFFGKDVRPIGTKETRPQILKGAPRKAHVSKSRMEKNVNSKVAKVRSALKHMKHDLAVHDRKASGLKARRAATTSLYHPDDERLKAAAEAADAAVHADAEEAQRLHPEDLQLQAEADAADEAEHADAARVASLNKKAQEAEAYADAKKIESRE